MGDGKWLNRRLADIEDRLDEQGHKVSLPVISRLLRAHDYRLRVNVKELVGKQDPGRDVQFQHILAQRSEHKSDGQPTLSVDTKKKELIGNFKTPGRAWGREPEKVDVHDFPQDAVGRAVPYGLYDIQQNRGTVYVGQSADTPAFAVDNIVRWCQTERLAYYPEASRLLIEADSGGSNGYRSRVWKRDLQAKVADAFGLTVTVCHYPTGGSKWNPIVSYVQRNREALLKSEI
jgi:Rhodopirellula transposase DDE domain